MQTYMSSSVLLPFSVEELARHLYLRLNVGDTGSEGNPEVEYLEGLIRAAVGYAESEMRCSIMQRQVLARFFEGEKLILRYGPVMWVDRIYEGCHEALNMDISGVQISDSDYKWEYHGHSVVIIPRRYIYPMVVDYRAGWLEGTLPPAIKHAIMCHCGTLYEHRESVSDLRLDTLPHLAAFYRQRRRSLGIG
jgi:hypothetical protein